jgi:predicted GTPase
LGGRDNHFQQEINSFLANDNMTITKDASLHVHGTGGGVGVGVIGSEAARTLKGYH